MLSLQDGPLEQFFYVPASAQGSEDISSPVALQLNPPPSARATGNGAAANAFAAIDNMDSWKTLQAICNEVGRGTHLLHDKFYTNKAAVPGSDQAFQTYGE